MRDKKALKVLTATVMAASAFATLAPMQSEAATNSVDKAVNKATNQMVKVYSTYKNAINKNKLPGTETIKKQLKLAQNYYAAAVKEINKKGGSAKNKAAYTKKLNAKKQYLKRIENYVAAININVYSSKIAFEKAVEGGKQGEVLQAQTELNKKITQFEKAVAKIYGSNARKLLISKYSVPAKKQVASVKDEMVVYQAYKQIESQNLIKKDIEKAGKLIDNVKDEVARLQKKGTKLAKNIVKAVNKNNTIYLEEKGVVLKQTALDKVIADAKEGDKLELTLQATENLKIETTKSLTFTLNGNLNGKDLTIIAPNVHITNRAADAGKIMVTDVSNSSYEQQGTFDSLAFNDTNGGRLINGTSNPLNVTLGNGAKVTLNGQFGTVTASGVADVTLEKSAIVKELVANGAVKVTSGEGAKVEKTTGNVTNTSQTTGGGGHGGGSSSGGSSTTLPETINQQGTYGPTSGMKTITGNLTISSKDVTLQNVVIKGDLYITEAVGDGNVYLKNVKVEGKTYVKGGGINSIHFEDSVLATVIVNKNDGRVRIVATGSTQVVEVQLESYAKIEEENLDSGSEGFTEVNIDPTVQTTNPALQIELVGQFETINSRASQVRITLDGTTDIRTLVLNAIASVLGTGRINTAEINADGSTISSRPTNTVLNNGTAATIGGSEVTESYSEATSTNLSGVKLTQDSIFVKLESFVAGLTIDDFDVKATLDGTDIPLENLEYHPNSQTITFTPVTLTNNIGKTLRVEVTPKGKLSGAAVTSETQIATGFSGRITDVAAVGFEGVTIKFRSGTNNRDGAIVAEATTDKNGYYTVNLPAGEYTGEISGENVVTTYLYATAPSDVFNTNQNETAIRTAASNEMKIVVSWGEHPYDVDSHLIGSKLNGELFHVYYGNKVYAESLNPENPESLSETYVDLDWDDTDSYGPETTTLRKLKDGKYVFYLHNFSGETKLRDSGAVIQIFKGNATTPTQTYTLTPGDGTERYWLGFGLEISDNGNQADIIPVETFDRSLNFEKYNDLAAYLQELITDGENYLAATGETVLSPEKRTIIQDGITAAKAINISQASFSTLLTEVAKLKNILNLNTDLYPEVSNDNYSEAPTSALEFLGETINENGTAKYALKSDTSNAIDLYVEGRDAQGDNTYVSRSDIQWSSSDETVATVDEYGSVSTKPVTENKTVTITARYMNGEQTIEKTIELTVSPNEPEIQTGTLAVAYGQAEVLDAEPETPGIQIYLDGNTQDGEENGAVNVTFTGKDQYGHEYSPVVTSTSGNTDIVAGIASADTVTITAANTGSTKVLVTVGGEQVELDVKVTEPAITAKVLSELVAKAQAVVNGLADAVNNAGDAAAKQAAIDEAKAAVDAVKALDASYDTTEWDTVIASQVFSELVAKAQEAVNGLADAVNNAGDAAAKQAAIDEAKAAVDAVKALDASYDTSAWDATIANQQQAIVNP